MSDSSQQSQTASQSQLMIVADHKSQERCLHQMAKDLLELKNHVLRKYQEDSDDKIDLLDN